MTPKEQRNERLAERMIKNLKRRNMEAFYCPTAEEAVKKVSELIADGSSVTWGGSMTIRDMGIPKALKERGTLEVLDRDEVTDREEVVKIYEKAFTADVYLSSANAISEDGVIVNIDGNIIGMNKVAQTVEAALARARSTAAPINSARFDIKTPCQTDGVCHNCNSPESICNYVSPLYHRKAAVFKIIFRSGIDKLFRAGQSVDVKMKQRKASAPVFPYDRKSRAYDLLFYPEAFCYVLGQSCLSCPEIPDQSDDITRFCCISNREAECARPGLCIYYEVSSFDIFHYYFVVSVRTC